MSYPSCAAEVTVDASALKEGDVAGLCALQSCYAAVGITKHHGKYEVLMPVSYTHLDVYKRQMHILEESTGNILSGWFCGGSVFKYLKRNYWLMIRTVSYTHLFCFGKFVKDPLPIDNNVLIISKILEIIAV